MFLKDIDPARLALLTAEQLEVVKGWDKEAQERALLIPALCGAYNSGDKEKSRELGEKILSIGSRVCAHDRDMMGTCMSCSEIEDILFDSSEEDE